ncbi:hypothetical protein D9M68_744020 [compost metagenome]
MYIVRLVDGRTQGIPHRNSIGEPSELVEVGHPSNMFLDPLLLTDVGNETLQCKHLSVAGINAAALLPHPFNLSCCSTNPIRGLVTGLRSERPGDLALE